MSAVTRVSTSAPLRGCVHMGGRGGVGARAAVAAAALPPAAVAPLDGRCPRHGPPLGVVPVVVVVTPPWWCWALGGRGGRPAWGSDGAPAVVAACWRDCPPPPRAGPAGRGRGGGEWHAYEGGTWRSGRGATTMCGLCVAPRQGGVEWWGCGKDGESCRANTHRNRTGTRRSCLSSMHASRPSHWRRPPTQATASGSAHVLTHRPLN